jgi:glycine cleavage system H protein
MIPSDRRYTRDHEWVRLDGSTATVGITEYAAHELGDVVFVDLPAVGRDVAQAGAFGVVESVKAVSDLFAPIAGRIAEVNEALAGRPELVNEDPYGDGWMIRIEVEDPGQVAALLDAAAYEALTAEG